MVFEPIPAWNVIVFENNNEDHILACRHFAENIFSAYMSHPSQLPDLKYYFKQTETQTIFYLSPDVSAFSGNLLHRYGGLLLLDKPDLSGCKECSL